MTKKKIISLAILMHSIMLYSQKITTKTISDQFFAEMGVLGITNENQYAQYISPEQIDINTIKKIDFKILAQKKNSYFYLNIYKKDGEKPREILKHILVKTKYNSKSQKISLDFSDAEFTFPKEGFFIGLEWVLEKKNKMIPDMIFSKNQEALYYPNVAATTGEVNYIWSLKNNVWSLETSENNIRSQFDLNIN